MRARARRARTSPGPSSGDSGNTRLYIIIGVVVIGLIGLSFLLYLSLREPPPIAGLVTYPRPSRGHDNSLQIPFEGLPPAGGVHNDAWQNCGIYEEPVLPQNAVHSLEHGAVWVTYNPEMLAEEEVGTLQNRVRGQNYLLLSPFPNQPSPVVLTAWGLQLEVDSVTDERIETFIERYQSGPQTPERGAACTGGIGNPLP